MMIFSKRTNWPTAANPLSQALDALKKSGAAVIDLTESNPTRCRFHYPDAVVSALADPRNLNYEPDPRGILSAREAVCRYYAEKGVPVAPERVFLTASTSEAYQFLFRLLLDPGGEALVPAPGYPLFDFLADLNDISLRAYPLIYKNAWQIDARGLERALEPAENRPRILTLVHPNNPTGHFVGEDERALVNRLCGDRTAILSDEVFLDYAYGEAGKTFADNDSALTFTLSGVSKLLGLPQMKLSWIVLSGPADACRAASEKLELIADTHLSVNTPAQRALPVWLDKGADVRRQILQRVQANRRCLERTLAGKNVSIFSAQAGWYAMVSLAGKSDEAFALKLLDEEKVFAHPGYFFNVDADDVLVFSLLPPPAVFEEGMARVSRAARV